MPRQTANRPANPAIPVELIAELVEQAAGFAPPDKALALVRKWVRPQDMEHLTEEAAVVRAAEAAMLASDLLLSTPSVTGTTALDRLAKARHAGGPPGQAARQALRQSRFRLLITGALITGAGRPGRLSVRDLLSGDTLCLVDADLPALPPETILFGRVALLGNGFATLAGAVTPLDAAAFGVARHHPAAEAPGPRSGARWAEAVYGHVVRYGTVLVPGLNRPPEGWADDEPVDPVQAALLDLTAEWGALEGGAPDAALLQRTRAQTCIEAILAGLSAAAMARGSDAAEIGSALERLLPVMLETVQRRSAGGSGSLTLEGIGRLLEDAIAAGAVLPEARAIFAAMRARLGGSPARAGDAELDRLVARIHALRAKTVAQGCTEQEAMAAAEKVAELLDRYGLTLDELDVQAQPCEGIGIQTSRRRLAAIDACIPAIAEFFDCRVWLEQAKGTALRYVFFGLRGDVTAAHYLYEMVERAFETETAAFQAGRVYAEMAGDRRSATESFRTGLAQGIVDKLGAIRTRRDATRRSASGRDLVPVKAAVVETEMAKLGLHLRQKAAGRGKRVLSDAFDAGHEAGQRFEPISAIADAA